MRFPGKQQRKQTAQVSYDDFNWDAWKGPGWWRAVILDVKSTQTQSGADMFKLVIGLENPGQTGGRVMHYVPETYPPKLLELVVAFRPDLLESDEGGDLQETDLRFRRCAVRVEEDAEYQRDDGAIAYRVAQLISEEKADGALGRDWDQPALEDAPVLEAVDDGGQDDDLF